MPAVGALGPTVGDRVVTQVLTVGADVLRLGGVVSLAVAVVSYDGIAVALFALVLLGLLVPRVLRVPPALDVVNGVAVLVAAWSAVLDLYDAVRWWDLVVHAVCTGALAAVAASLLDRAGAAGVRGPAAASRRAAALGLVLGVLWEIGEWTGHTFLDPEIYIGPADTLGDVLAGVVGAAVAGAAIGAGARVHHSGNASTTYSARVDGSVENRRNSAGVDGASRPAGLRRERPDKKMHGH